MNKYNFIKTDSEDTAQKLRNKGFTELKKQGSWYVFVNEMDKIVDFDKSHVTYTNILNF